MLSNSGQASCSSPKGVSDEVFDIITFDGSERRPMEPNAEERPNVCIGILQVCQRALQGSLRVMLEGSVFDGLITQQQEAIPACRPDSCVL